MGKVSKPMFLGSIFGGYLLGIILMIAGVVTAIVAAKHAASTGEGPSAAAAGGISGLVLLAYIPLIFGAVMAMILLYKMWAAIQGPTARTTPGKAVGFLFIPFFNIYWLFVAYWGWAVDYNKFTASRGLQAKRAPEGLFLAMCIVPFASIIPIVGALAGLAALVLMYMFFSFGCDAINALADAGANQGAAPAAPSAPPVR